VVKYEVIEHTADIGIRVKGKDLKDLFINAGLAVFRLLAEKKITKGIKYRKLSIKQKAVELDVLFIDWLNELLSLSQAKGIIFTGFKINKLTENALEAVATGSDMKNYRVNREVKAATYHRLSLQKSAIGWQAEVILDV
jgi:SHS2 domain-containing protein